jgi:hypothetical protein
VRKYKKQKGERKTQKKHGLEERAETKTIGEQTSKAAAAFQFQLI